MCQKYWTEHLQQCIRKFNTQIQTYVQNCELEFKKKIIEGLLSKGLVRDEKMLAHPLPF